MADTPVKQSSLDESLLQINASMSEASSTVEYTTVDSVDVIDTSITKFGITGTVSRTGSKQSSNMNANVLAFTIGDPHEKDYINIFKVKDSVNFQPYVFSDVVNAIPSVTIEVKCGTLYLEEYSFSGTIIDCLRELAGLVYGSVSYNSEDKKYILVGGDTTLTDNSKGITIDDSIISYETFTEKNTKVADYVSSLITSLQDLARLRADLEEIAGATVDSNVSSRDVFDIIDFDFGQKTGPKQVPTDIIVENGEWDIWYEDIKGKKWKSDSSASGNEFKSDYSKYFKTEIISEAMAGENPVPYTKKRGLKHLFGVKFLKELKNTGNAGRLIYAKGYLFNLESLGIPTVTEFEEKKTKNAADGVQYDTAYNIVYSVVTRDKKELDTESSIVVTSTASYLEMSPRISLCNEIKTGWGITKTAAEKMHLHQFGAKLHLTSSSSTIPLQYKGALDKFGRLISNSGQVLLVLCTPLTGIGAGISVFYKPIVGMDLNLYNTATTPTPTPTPTPTSTVIELIDETSIKTSILAAWEDLKTKCMLELPVAKYAAVPTGKTRYIVSYIDPPIPTGRTTPPPAPTIGIQYPYNDAVDSSGNVLVPLTTSAYQSTDRTKKFIKLKIKCIESKISFITSCIKKANDTSQISDDKIKALAQKIVKYEIVAKKVKDTDLEELVTLRDAMMTAINDLKSLLLIGSSTTITKMTVSCILDTIPRINTKVTIRLPESNTSSTWKVTSVSVSNFVCTITGEPCP